LSAPGDFPRRLRHSRFICRFHRCAHWLATLFQVLASLGHALNPASFSVIDSFPVADGDAKVLMHFNLALPEGSTLMGDKAYNDYVYEDLLREARLFLIPLRKVNSSRPLEPALTYRIARARKAVETTGSLIERLLPQHIHSVTARGFELKLACFVIACALGFIA
jgi:hypothetical protein